MSWAPAGLSDQLQRLVRAMDGQFAPRIPTTPPRLPRIKAAKLTDDLAERHPSGSAINADTNKQVISVLVAGAWTWRNSDGSAL